MPSLMQGSGHIKMQQPKNVFHYYFTRCPGKGAVFGFFLGALITSIFLDETSIWTLSQRWMNSLNSSARQKFTSPIVTISGSLNSQQMNHPSSLTREFAITTSGNDEPSKAIGSFQVRQTTQRTSEIAGGNDEDTLKNVLLDQWASFYVKQVNSSNSQHLNIQYANSRFLEPIHPPHMRNCRDYTKKNKRLDSRFINGKRPRWSLWKGLMGIKLGNSIDPEDTGEEMLFNKKGLVEGPYPPWVKGADEDNLPRTRRVQRDLWVKQHPRNCSDPQLKFLVADWETDPGYGIGAQIAAMIGLLAIAMNENRILVTGYFNRADHEDCVGPKRSHWSCYFLSETSNECRTRALELASRNQSWELGIITSKEQYNSKRIWSGKIPQHWGKAWKQMQPTTEVDGELLLHHQATDRRWWRAQALRYLMRYPSQHMCVLMNDARHRAFGAKAAEMVLQSMTLRQSKVSSGKNSSSIETFVWSDYDPWTPKPLISIHVRQGDKASEMKVVGLEKYMELAQRLRERFPNAKDVWLSTEMQDIVEESTRTPSWNFYFTNITRQHGDTGMATYEAGLGREDCSNNAFVNFLMAAEADYFIGALGSTWCFLIDGMRSTGGKVMAGYLSVNKDRFW